MSAHAALEGKLAVVTGATSGIGQATVARLLRAGAEVVGLGRDVTKLAQARSDSGGRLRTIHADLAEPEARRAAVAALLSLPRAPDIFVSNAAECVYESALALPAARLSRLFEVNVTAAIELTQAIAGQMSPGGHLLQVTSVVAKFLPGPKYAPYAASKAALDCLTEALRLELHPRGIRVSAIAPGLVDTPIYDDMPEFSRAKAKIRELVPNWLTATDVAEAIVWMLSVPRHAVVSELTLLPSAQVR